MFYMYFLGKYLGKNIYHFYIYNQKYTYIIPESFKYTVWCQYKLHDLIPLEGTKSFINKFTLNEKESNEWSIPRIPFNEVETSWDKIDILFTDLICQKV